MLADQVAEYEQTEKKRGWFVLLEPPVGLWLNLAHAEVRGLLETHTQRLRFAERTATSICERNALRAHPAIAKSQVEAHGAKPRRWTNITVYGFRHDLDRKQLERLTLSVADGEMDRMKAEAAALGIRDVEVDTKDVTPDDAHDDGTDVEDGEGAPAGEETTTTAVPGPIPEEIGGERQKVLADLKLARQAFADDRGFFKAVAEAGIKGMLSDAPLDALKGLLKVMSRTVDQRMAHGATDAGKK